MARRDASDQACRCHTLREWDTLQAGWKMRIKGLIDEITSITVAQNHYVRENFHRCVDVFSRMWHRHTEFVVVRDRLATARGFVFDMDGTLVLGDRTSNRLRPLPGALEITRRAAQRGRPFVVRSGSCSGKGGCRWRSSSWCTARGAARMASARCAARSGRPVTTSSRPA